MNTRSYSHSTLLDFVPGGFHSLLQRFPATPKQRSTLLLIMDIGGIDGIRFCLQQLHRGTIRVEIVDIVCRLHKKREKVMDAA